MMIVMAASPDAAPAGSRTVAIIPARGGSKGIPRKNLQPVGGVPLVVRTIDSARRAASLDLLVLTTDDADIAERAAAAGARVVDRPDAHSTDEASSESALLHALEVLTDEGAAPAVVAFLQCTSPFTRPEDVDAAVAAVVDGGADVAFTGTATHQFLWRASDHGDGSVVGANHDLAHRPRRQDRDPEWVENGAVYAMRADGFVRARHRFFGRVVVVDMPAERSIDVDAPGDLALCRTLAPGLDRDARLARLAGVQALVFDFDGVLTDNGVWTAQDGTESVRSDRSDGLGIEHLRDAGLPMVVISKETNPVVAARCAKLRLEVAHGCDDKVEVLDRWLAERGIGWEATAYVGNDVNDLPCMGRVGCAIAPADADPAVLAVAHVVLDRPGGRGAVRELADLLLAREA